jgi:hypothetical protein
VSWLMLGGRLVSLLWLKSAALASPRPAEKIAQEIIVWLLV